jgi:hypothetical protein
MNAADYRFTFMTIVFSVTLGLLISMFDGPLAWPYHFILKFGFAIPSLLLMVDMWIHYNNYYQQDKREYTEWNLILDTVLLSLMYAAFSGLKAIPDANDEAFSSYPPASFWYWLLAYSLLKIWRSLRMSRVPGRLSWYLVLHVILLCLIFSGWSWQAGWLPVPFPFWASGFVFSFVVFIYMAIVHLGKHDPLRPVRSGE